MLYSLLDGRTRTGTELAVIAEVSPSTASVHLKRLLEQRLVKVVSQGRHRYYSLQGKKVAAAIEALCVLAGRAGNHEPRVPSCLRAARTCYDHIAGILGVALHDRFVALGWLRSGLGVSGRDCELTAGGANAFRALDIDIDALRRLRRRFAYSCLDWSERRPHLGGALGSALLSVAVRRTWVSRDLNSRSLEVTAHGREEIWAQLGLRT
jgi:DNA-binding MarR family transcriptional regulator